MALKIGVISPEQPPRSLPVMYANKGSSWFWFNEMEAGFAYLLNDHLDRLFIDRSLINDVHAYTQKYQKLIEQLHPRLEMSVTSFAEAAISTNDHIFFFPKLDTLFKNGELKSVFQPIIEWRDDAIKIHGVECLSRVTFNNQNYAPEFIFNYAAEKQKLTNYDRICLMQALSLVPHDNESLIFVNVRPQTLIGDGFNPWFRGLLKKHQLLPEQIVIEVTEQYCNISELEMSTQCKNLKDQGLRLAIDDFGSGISNLSMLEVMKPSYIKISGRFIKNSHENIAKQKIIKNVIALAEDFNITPIVESVEHEQEWLLAKNLGAYLAQGFYFYRPMAKEDLSPLLRAPRRLETVR